MAPQERNVEQRTAAAPTPLSRTKKTVFWCLLLCLGTFVGLVIAEITVRLFDLKPEGLRRKTVLINTDDPASLYFCYSSNPIGEFRPVPDVTHGNWKLHHFPDGRDLPLSDLQKSPWCVNEQSSPQAGLRDRLYPLTPPPGIFRITMIGDSFTRGEGVAIDHSMPKQLEAMLGTNRYEVVNVGFSGQATETEVTNAELMVAQLKPKLVILVFIPNDIHLTEELEKRQRYINDLINIREDLLTTGAKISWYESSRLIQLASSAVKLRQIGHETAQWYLDSYDPRYNNDGLQRLGANFKRLASIPDCRIAVVIYPLMYDLEKGYPLMPIHRTVKKLAQEARLPVLDLAPFFIGYDTRSLQVHPCDHHPNRRAHEIAARAIKEWLEKDMPELLTN